jgi:RNA polymerase sigma-70 factor, ECF subfamily
VGKNSSSFWQLVEKEHRSARAYCNRLAGNTTDGDDLYQDSVIKAYRGFAGLQNPESFRPWFYRIIGNTYKSRFRSPWWRRVLSQPVKIEDVEQGHDPTGVYEARRRLEHALSAVSTDDRILVTLAELEGWKISELSELMSTSEGAIKMRLSRARTKMRQRLSTTAESKSESTEEGRRNVCCAPEPEQD